jgi:hypothetical protein
VSDGLVDASVACAPAVPASATGAGSWPLFALFALFGFLHFSGFCSFLRFFGFRAISRALDAISRKTWQIRHQKAPNCLIGYPNLSLSFSLL